MAGEKDTVKDSKNVITGSTIRGEGDVQIGDVHTNSNNVIFNLSIGKFTAISISLAGLTLLFVLKVISIPGFYNSSPSSIQETGNTIQNETALPENGKKEENHAPSQLSEPKPTDESASVRTIQNKPVSAKNPLLALVNTTQATDVAFYQSANLGLSLLRDKVQETFNSRQLQVSDGFFKPAFAAKFGKKLTTIDLAEVSSMGLEKHVRCICQILEDIQVTNSEVEGTPVFTAGGSVKIAVYSLATGKLSLTEVGKPLKGAGMSESSAMTSFEEKILRSSGLEKVDWAQCK